MTLASTDNPQRIGTIEGPPTSSRLTTDAVALHDPDTHLMLGVDTGSCRARCSLWWTDAPEYENHQVGLVGHYASADDDAARALLSAALDRLRTEGCTIAIGPMDGSTWFSYRFVTGGSDRTPFFLEPEHPAPYPDQFVAAGFAPLTHYFSADVPELDTKSPGPPPVGVSVRSLSLDQREKELARLYDLVRQSFAENVLYRPISEERFGHLYGRLLSSVDPSLVRLAETANGNLVGVAFLVPDRRMAERGAAVDTVIAKTLAVRPDVAGQGLGRWLLAEAQWRARQQGYTCGIHALMQEDNRSRRISQHYGDPFRRYTLFAQEL